MHMLSTCVHISRHALALSRFAHDFLTLNPLSLGF